MCYYGRRQRDSDNYDQGLTLETSAIFSFTPSITLINTQLIQQIPRVTDCVGFVPLLQILENAPEQLAMPDRQLWADEIPALLDRMAGCVDAALVPVVPALRAADGAPALCDGHSRELERASRSADRHLGWVLGCVTRLDTRHAQQSLARVQKTTKLPLVHRVRSTSSVADLHGHVPGRGPGAVRLALQRLALSSGRYPLVHNDLVVGVPAE